MTTENTLSEYDDDALAEMAGGFKAEADRLFRLARGAHEELREVRGDPTLVLTRKVEAA